MSNTHTLEQLLKILNQCRDDHASTDGHWWVELADGTIIDPEFKEYERIKQIRKLTHEKCYLPASPIIQAVFLRRQKEKCEAVEWNFADMKKNHWRPKFLCCDVNSWYFFLKHKEEGAKLVFGSFGWREKGSDKIWYEYGGADYKTVKDFRH